MQKSMHIYKNKNVKKMTIRMFSCCFSTPNVKEKNRPLDPDVIEQFGTLGYLEEVGDMLRALLRSKRFLFFPCEAMEGWDPFEAAKRWEDL